MPDTGYQLPTDDSIVIDNGTPWDEPYNAYDMTGGYCTEPGEITSNPTESDIHLWNDFDFSSVPTDRTLMGVSLECNCWTDIAPMFIYFRLHSGGTNYGNTRTISLPDSRWESLYLGGPGDFWGSSSITNTLVRNSNFGITMWISLPSNAPGGNVRVDYLRMKVYWLGLTTVLIT